MSTRAGAIVAILAAWSVVAVGDDIAQRKASAIRTALEKQGRAETATALIDSSSRASAITAVEMDAQNGAPEVVISTEGKPEYSWFKLDSGKRIVIDFANTIHLQSGLRLAPIGAAPIARVRSSLFELEPAFKSRIVIDLAEVVKPEFAQEDGRVIVRFGTGAPAPETTEDSGETDKLAETIALAQSKLEDARLRVLDSITKPVLDADMPTSERVKSILAASAEESKALEVRLAALIDEHAKPLTTQQERLAELKNAQTARILSDEKIATTLASITSEVETASNNANTALEALEQEISETRSNQANAIAAAQAEEKAVATVESPVVMAAAVEPAAPPAPIEAAAVAEVEAPSEEPVASAIAKIEQDLASIRGTSESTSDAVEEQAEMKVEERPVAPVLLAKLDEISVEMEQLEKTIAAASVQEDIEPLATTEAVAIELPGMQDISQTVSAAVTDAGVAAASEVEPIVVAQAEASPEPGVEVPAEESPATDEVPAESAEGVAEAAPAAEAETPSVEEEAAPAEAPVVPEPAAIEEESSEPMQPPKIIAIPTPEEREDLPAGMDPLDQPVNIDFREMDLSSVVSLLAKKAQVNVIAGTEVTGTVTADIRNVPLRKAMDMVLRMNGLGIVEEEGIFRIVPYEDAVASRRMTRMVALDNAQAEDVRTTLEGILVGGRDAKIVSIAANKNTNVIIISGPEESVADFERLARELDVKEPTLPTVTEAIKLNYLDPKMAKPIIETIKTEKIGKVEVDQEGRHIIVTDVPAAVEQMKALLINVDKPVKQVAVEAMIVDAVLRDASQTGVDWTIEAIRRNSSNGDLVSDLSQLSLDGSLGNIGSDALDAGILSLGILSSEVRINAAIAAEAQSRNAEILANPSIVTVENNPATISIVQEFPYQEITQGLTGPPVASTEFKPIGVTLEVTPRITHANDTIVEISAKQSSVSGLTESGVPIEDKREATTKLRAENGRTIFIGGLRNVSDRLNVSKIPILGDIPVLNFMFRNTDTEKINTELLIFLTCHVLAEELPELSATQTEAYDKLDSTPKVPDAQRANFHDIVQPQDMRDPFWKWRRSNR